jgi:hypothetical protein
MFLYAVVGLLLIAWIVGAITLMCWGAYEIAHAKDRSGIAWLFLALFFGPFAVVLVYLLPAGVPYRPAPALERSPRVPGHVATPPDYAALAQQAPLQTPAGSVGVPGDDTTDGLTLGERYLRDLYDRGLSDAAVIAELGHARVTGALSPEDYAAARALHDTT